MTVLSSFRLIRIAPLLGVTLLALALATDRAGAITTVTPTPSLVEATASLTASIPPEYASMYDSLAADLDTWETAVRSLPPTGGATPIFGGHVLAANGNRGTSLLAPTTLPVVDLTLDRLKELGVGGVTVSVSFPLLNVDYPRSAEYLAFYQTVAQHVRARGLALTVEQHIAFHDTPFSSVSFDFSQLPFAQFETEFHAMSQAILDGMHPDYLTLLSEPDTFARLTGYQQAQTPTGAAGMIDTVAAGLQRGTTKMGAGSGSWLPSATAYASAFAGSSVDYVDLHIYPVDAPSLDRAQRMVDAARAAGKPVVLDEAWLYKVAPDEPPATDFDQTAAIFKRDNYSFWAPLDARFLTLLKTFVRANGIVYAAPFWTSFFWAYIDYGPSTKDLTYPQTTQLVNQSVFQALQNDTFTSTGEAWQTSAGAAVGGDAQAPDLATVPVPAQASAWRHSSDAYLVGGLALVAIVALGMSRWYVHRKHTQERI